MNVLIIYIEGPINKIYLNLPKINVITSLQIINNAQARISKKCYIIENKITNKNLL